jgi:ABC-2 type transport system ATP-binding protein
MTVQEVLAFVGKLYEHWDSELADLLLDKFELPLSKRVSALSKGMTAKLGLLLALCYHPEILILDEPTSGLDPIIREDFLASILQSHSGNGRTVLFSSHHVDDVERVSDEVGIIVAGRLAVQGSPDELRSRFKRIRAVLRDGTLPSLVPTEVILQKTSRRKWLLTVKDFSDELVARIQSENDLVSMDVIDLNLEEIFKDVVRGLSQKPAE